MITVGNEAEALKLYAKRLRFEGTPDVIEKYWPDSVCMTYLGIGHDRLEGCGEKTARSA